MQERHHNTLLREEIEQYEDFPVDVQLPLRRSKHKLRSILQWIVDAVENKDMTLEQAYAEMHVLGASDVVISRMLYKFENFSWEKS